MRVHTHDTFKPQEIQRLFYLALFSTTGPQAIPNYKQKMDWRDSIEQQCWNNWQQHFMKRYISKQIISVVIPHAIEKHTKQCTSENITLVLLMETTKHLIIWDFSLQSIVKLVFPQLTLSIRKLF